MAEGQRFKLNASVAGVGKKGEVVVVDPTLWSRFIDAGYMAPLDEDASMLATAATAAGHLTAPREGDEYDVDEAAE
jgi:hypothetical protein